MRCAIYTRVSTDKDEQKQSLENQKLMFLNLISDRGWDLHDIYVDVQSGTKAKKRKDLIRLIEDAKNKKFDIILSKELSRLARNGQLSYEIKNLAENYGIHILTLDGAIDTLNRNTENFGLFAWLYEQESQRTSVRIKGAYQVRASKGEFLGSIPPYGYYIDNKQLKVKKDFTPDVIRRIFNSYLSGKGFDAIARELLEEGVPSPSQVARKSNKSHLWHESTIKKILGNAHYIGDLVQLRETSINVTTDKRKENDPSNYSIVENVHEAIISKSDFDLVQQLMKERSQKRPYAKKHLFTNIAYCSTCGKRMHFKANRKGYVCGNYNKHGRTQCSDHHVKEKVLIDAINSDMQSMFSTLRLESFRKEVERKFATMLEHDKKRFNKIDDEINKLKQDKVDTLRAKIRKEISNEEYQLLTDDCNNQISRLMQERQNTSETLSHKQNNLNLEELFSQLEQYVQNPILDETILHKLIERIEINEDGSARIYYRFSHSYISSIFFQATHNTQHGLRG